MKYNNNDYWGMALQILQENDYEVFACICDDDTIFWEARKYIDEQKEVYDRLIADNMLSLLGLMQILPDWKSKQKI